MIAWLLKNWKLFLDILLVVGGIVLFTLFDPFGVFSGRSLKNTANVLSSVKSIGELVTAEYYGEVISSLHGTMVYDYKPDTLQQEFERCLVDIKTEIEENYFEKLGDQSKLKNRQKRQLLNTIPQKLGPARSKYNNPSKIYNHLIAFVASNEYKKDAQEFFNLKTASLRNNTEKNVIETLLNECIVKNGQNEITITNADSTKKINYKYDVPQYFAKAADFHYSLNKSHLKKTKKRKQDIVFIGRGWVKAGFKFDQLNESNFYYNEQRNTIWFYGLSSEVLDKDINPWFIPEKRVKGYELVDFYKKATFEEAKAVKIRCKEELLEQAHKAAILEQAQINGEESLQSFFALLTGKPKLKVKFSDLPYKQELNMISADTLITVNEALLIKQIIEKETLRIKTAISPDKEHYEQQLGIFINQLKHLHFVKKGIAFNLFMLEAAEILAHKKFISLNDSLTIGKIRGTIILTDKEEESFLTTNYLDSQLFHNSYPEFVPEFNSMLTVLERELKEIDAFRSDTFTLNKTMLQKLNIDTAYFWVQSISGANDLDTIEYYKITHKHPERSFSFTNFKYPHLQIPTEALDTIKITNVNSVDSLLLSIAKTNDILSNNIQYDTIRKSELNTILAYESKKIKDEISARPIKRFTATVQKLFSKK